MENPLVQGDVPRIFGRLGETARLAYDRAMKALVLALMIAGVAAPALAEGNDARFAATILSLSAEGEVRVAPDEAWLQTGVTSNAPTAALAVGQNRARMNAVVAALKGQGVADADVQTSALQLSAQYTEDSGSARRLTGYAAHNGVTVRVRNLPRVGAIVDVLVGAGANEIEGVDFDLADRRSAEDQARRLAAKALAAKAELYAEATGYHVKRLVTLSEGGGPVFQPMMRMAAPMAMAARAPTPIAPGELTVSVNVSGEYELAR